jgi:hypothetical protein
VSARGPGKLPRVDLRKFLAGGVAGQREAVALVGDALREEGAVRVEGYRPGGEPGEPTAEELAAVGIQLLSALGDYFGISRSAFSGTASAADGAGGDDSRTLLVVLAGAPAGAEVRSGAGAWRPMSAHSGELVALPGPALAALTAGVVPAASARWPGQEQAAAAALGLPAGASTAPLPEFRRSGKDGARCAPYGTE